MTDWLGSKTGLATSARPLMFSTLALTISSTLLWGDYTVGLPESLYGDGYQQLDSLIRWFAQPLAFLAVALWSWKRGQSGGTRYPPAAFLLLEAGGLLLIALLLLPSAPTFVAPLASLLLTLGSTLLFTVYFVVLTSLDATRAQLVIVVSTSLAGAMLAVLSLLPDVISLCVTFVFLTPLSLMSFARCEAQNDLSAGFAGGTRGRDARLLASRLRSPVVYVGSVAFVVGLFQALTIDGGSLEAINRIKCVGMFLSGLILGTLWSRASDFDSPEFLGRVMFPLVATSYLFLPALTSDAQELVVGFSFLVFSMASMVMVATALEVARELSAPTLVVYPLFAGVVYLVVALGSALAELLGLLDEGQGSTTLFVIALAAVWGLAMFQLRRRRGVEGSPPVDAQAGCPDREPRDTGDAAHGTGASRDQAENRLLSQHPLTRREAEVARLLLRGRDVPTIADMLVISENTVRSHAKSIYAKMGVHTRRELIDMLDIIIADEGTEREDAVAGDARQGDVIT